MQITDIETIEYERPSRTRRDARGHSHPGPEQETRSTLTRLAVNGGPDGYCPGGSVDANEVAKRHLVGEDPLYREALWDRLYHTQRLHRGTLHDGALCALDLALWDVAGRVADLPVYKLLGATRDRVPVYASTMVGDDDPDGLGTPAAYAEFATDLVGQGFEAIKLHSWMPPYDTDPNRVIEMCRLVREAVGPDIALMLDTYHFYSRTESKRIGDAIADLDFRWFEEPMDEHAISAYEWLTNEVNIPVIGPETMEGKMQTRAEWAKRGVVDIGRVGVTDVGGLTPAKKTVNLYEAFGMECESHGDHIGNLHLLRSMAIPSRYHEYGLLHPTYDDEANDDPGVKNVPHPDDGVVKIPDGPGLGIGINWDYIGENRLS